MVAVLRAWVLSLAGAAVFCAVMTELCPKGAVKNVVKTLCGMVMALALISPVLHMDMSFYSMNLSQYRISGEEIAEGGKDLAKTQSRTFIEEECRAYILDKAEALGEPLEDAAVVLRWSGEGFWYPVECRLEGTYSGSLASAIEAELGIGRESQKWSGTDENS